LRHEAENGSEPRCLEHLFHAKPSR
jgi:hypothetical protein